MCGLCVGSENRTMSSPHIPMTAVVPATHSPVWASELLVGVYLRFEHADIGQIAVVFGVV